MKKIITILSMTAVMIPALALAGPGDWLVTYRNEDDTDFTTTQVIERATSTYAVLGGRYAASGAGSWYYFGSEFMMEPAGSSFGNNNYRIKISGLPTGNVIGLDGALQDLWTSIGAATSTLTTKFNTPIGTSTQYVKGDGTLATLPTVPSLAAVATSGSFSDLSGRPLYYHNGAAYTSAKQVTFTSTTTSGTVAFHLTTDGTSGGTAICSGAPKHVNLVVNDPSNTYGLGWALSNGNKTVTVTANQRSFSATTVLGISVLGSSSLTAAPNGTEISMITTCN